jgi:DNA-directed RNA polymerase subunit RPC12/RpoP
MTTMVRRRNADERDAMRYHCQFCGKSVTSELPDDSVIRSILVCPECIEAGRIVIPEPDEAKKGGTS